MERREMVVFLVLAGALLALLIGLEMKQGGQVWPVGMETPRASAGR